MVPFFGLQAPVLCQQFCCTRLYNGTPTARQEPNLPPVAALRNTHDLVRYCIGTMRKQNENKTLPALLEAVGTTGVQRSTQSSALIPRSVRKGLESKSRRPHAAQVAGRSCNRRWRCIALIFKLHTPTSDSAPPGSRGHVYHKAMEDGKDEPCKP